MVKRCIDAGCSNTHKDGYSSFQFSPIDPQLRQKWIETVGQLQLLDLCWVYKVL